MLRSPATATQITHRDRLWLYGLVGLVMAFLIVPCIIVIPMSFSDSQYLEFPPRSWSTRWYEAYFFSPEWRDATLVSVKVAVLTTGLATVFGTLAAYGLFLMKGRFAATARALLMLPMLVPIIFIAIGAFLVFARFDLNNTVTGLVLAHTTLAIPFVMIAVGNGLKTFDMNQERVAQTLGASRARAFLTVTLPQIKISVFTGMLFAFITSFDEVVVAIFIATGSTTTLTKRMFANIRDQVDPTVAAISSLLVGLSILILIATQLLQARTVRREEVG